MGPTCLSNRHPTHCPLCPHSLLHRPLIHPWLWLLPPTTWHLCHIFSHLCFFLSLEFFCLFLIPNHCPHWSSCITFWGRPLPLFSAKLLQIIFELGADFQSRSVWKYAFINVLSEQMCLPLRTVCTRRTCTDGRFPSSSQSLSQALVDATFSSQSFGCKFSNPR